MIEKMKTRVMNAGYKKAAGLFIAKDIVRSAGSGNVNA